MAVLINDYVVFCVKFVLPCCIKRGYHTIAEENLCLSSVVILLLNGLVFESNHA